MDKQMLEKLTQQIFSTKLREASIAMVDAAEKITEESRRDYVLIEPQWRWTAFRCDFRISIFRFWDNRTASVIVECDGHEFHEKTKEQAQRDKSRDRQFMLAGMSVLRFTGSEIWKSPTVCTSQIFKALGIPQCIDHRVEVVR